MEIGKLIRETRLSNYSHKKDGLLVLLNKEQFEKIKNTESDKNSFANGGFFDPLYSEAYIDPSQVIEYFIDNETFKGCPNQEVVIKFKDEWGESTIFNAPGSYVFFLEKDEKRKDILAGTISMGDVLGRKIESKYIKRDYSGIIVPITRDVLESELNEKKEFVDKGYRENFRGVKKLAKIAGIDFSKELKEAKEYEKKQYLKRYSKKEHLDNIFKLLRKNYDLFLNENCAYSDTVFEFLDIAHLIEYPDEIYKNKAKKCLGSISEAFLNEAKSLKEELEEIVREKEERIEELTNESTKVSWKKRFLDGENILI